MTMEAHNLHSDLSGDKAHPPAEATAHEPEIKASELPRAESEEALTEVEADAGAPIRVASAPDIVSPKIEAYQAENEWRWKLNLEELLAYKERFGDTLVPNRWSENPRLSRWVRSQRESYKNGSLPESRRQRLEEIGFAWTGRDPCKHDQWEERFEQLVRYKQEHGQTHVPREKDRVLSGWCRKQRLLWKNRKLLQEREGRLEAIGFSWQTEKPQWAAFVKESPANEQQWEQNFALLQEFIARHGHARVTRHGQEDLKLGRWVGKQREKWRNGKLSEKHKQRLDEVGFVWSFNHAAASNSNVQAILPPPAPGSSLEQWEHGFLLLEEFRSQHGRIQVTDAEPEHQALAAWLAEQRDALERGALLFSQVTRLKRMGMRTEA